MTENNKKKQSNNDLLFSNKPETVLETLSKLRETGSDNDLELLAELYTKTSNDEVSKAVNQFFCDLRNQSSTDSIIRLLQSISDKSTLKMLTSSCWQSRLNYINYFETFIDLVIYEGFEISFEAFTVLESFEEKTSAQRKKELISYTKNKISECKEENLAFAMDIVGIIEDYKE